MRRLLFARDASGNRHVRVRTGVGGRSGNSGPRRLAVGALLAATSQRPLVRQLLPRFSLPVPRPAAPSAKLAPSLNGSTTSIQTPRELIQPSRVGSARTSTNLAGAR